MIQIHPNFVERNGKNFVELPEEEFETLRELAEDMDDLMELEAALKEQGDAPTISSADLRKKLGLPQDS